MASSLDLVSESRKYIQGLSISPDEKKSRLESLEQFFQMGLPTAKQEDWKYFSWNHFAQSTYKPLAEGVTELSKISMAAGAFGLTSKDAVYYNPNHFFVWRFLNQELQQSPPNENPNQFSLKIQDQRFDQSVQGLRNKNSLGHLFRSLSTKAIVLEIPDNVSLSKPILIHELFVNALPTQQHQEIQIIIGKNSKTQVIYFDQSQGSDFFRQLRHKITVKENASVDLIRIQSLGKDATLIEDIEVSTEKGAQIRHLTVSLGAQNYRQNLVSNIQHSDVLVEANAMAILSENQLADIYTQLRHIEGGSLTKQTVKSLLGDQSKFNFNGMIVIGEGAKKANSEQLNKNLLLSPRAEANSKPQLQIYSDDVKATHGSTTGQLNKDEIFYFQSRAISEEKAIQMLSVGHVSELIYQIEFPVIQEFVLDQVSHKLNQMKFEKTKVSKS